MAIGSRVSGNLKSASGLFAKVNGGWKKAQFGYVKVEGEWKQFWADKLEDDFGRANTQSGLGVAISGQAWSVLRSLWQIKDNAANTTGTKTDYPLANVELGFIDFELEANELTPGTGVAVRVEDANNWWGVLPFYNQTAESYSYCVQSETVSYCIQACTEPYDYTLRCDPPNTLTSGDIYDFYCPAGYVIGERIELVDTGEVGCTGGGYVLECEDVETCVNKCVKYGSRGQCIDRDIVCTTKRVCGYVKQEPVCEPIFEERIVEFEYCPGGEAYGVVGSYQECGPDGFTNVPLYACCFAGTYERCVQSATGINYTNFYYLQVVKMVDGVFSVVSSVEVPSRWSAVKVVGNLNTLTATAYTDSLYTNAIGTFTTNTFTSAGTGYGVMSRASNFEDARTIGSIKVKALGQ
jgi:hypothetical protein